MKKDLSISMRLLFAALSGLGVALMMTTDLSIDSLDEGTVFYGLSGLLFAGGVLYPYVKHDRHRAARIIGIVAASALSYWVAVNLTIDGPWSMGVGQVGSNLWAFTISSFAGVAIVMIALLPAGPVTLSRSYALYGIAAALLGGGITSMTLDADNFFVMSSGFISWHLLVCLAIYFGTRGQREFYQAMP